MQILFVDDEESVLSGLRRALRKYRTEWEMQFAASGREALELMETRAFDAIVSDMRMPGMDGASLLQVAHERFPDTARFVLSGFAQSEAIMRAAAVAHQFLAKPCEPEAIKSAVDAALGLRSRLTDARLVEAVGRIDSLPARPTTYRKITEALACEDVTAVRIAQIVEADPAVTAKLLQLVNSSFFGLSRQISDVREAVSYLGQQTIRDLALSIGIFNAEAPPASPVIKQQLDHLEQHSARVALLARELAEGKPFAPLAFTAGILHDIGALVWATRRAPDYATVLEGDLGLDVTQRERNVIGADHAGAGAYLLGLWGLPYPILEAVAFHHCPRESSLAGGCDLPLVLHVAEALIEASEPGPADGPGLDEDYLEELGLLHQLDGWRERAARISETGGV